MLRGAAAGAPANASGLPPQWDRRQPPRAGPARRAQLVKRVAMVLCAAVILMQLAFLLRIALQNNPGDGVAPTPVRPESAPEPVLIATDTAARPATPPSPVPPPELRTSERGADPPTRTPAPPLSDDDDGAVAPAAAGAVPDGLDAPDAPAADPAVAANDGDSVAADMPAGPHVARPVGALGTLLKKWSLVNSPMEPPDEQELASRPLIEFVMIVKNEAASIAQTIASVKPYVDRWTILDTGSTDGTQELVRSAFAGVPGEVYEEPFVDFSTTRNRALELAGKRCVFNFMLSGDETLHNGRALRRFLEERRGWGWVRDSAKHEAYNVQVHYGRTVYDSTRIARTDAQWYYVGVTHEYMTSARKGVGYLRAGSAGEPLPYVLHDLRNSDPAKKRQRWQLDLQLLLGEWERSPGDHRTAFYTAQSYECLQRHAEALEWYSKRAALGGWVEEVYEAKFRRARVAKLLGTPWPEVQQLYLDAHTLLPARAEPLYAVAAYYHGEARPQPHSLAYLFAARAAALPFPSQLRLFVDKTVYDYKASLLVAETAWAVGEHQRGWEATQRVLKHLPQDVGMTRRAQQYLARKQGAPRQSR